MVVSVTNAQREAPVHKTRMARVATQAVRALRIRRRGTLAITFIDERRMRALNKRFLGHDRLTDVLSFQYDEAPRRNGAGPRSAARRQPIVGEILIAPRQARAYAKRHGIPYEQELSRYVVHGLLHWLGHEDRTAAEQRNMRKMEDRVLGLASADPTRLASRDIRHRSLADVPISAES